MTSPNLLKAALWYAKHGYSIFPLHEPIFNRQGHCVGCTCEEWKRKQPKYGPSYKCDQPGKCPRIKWHDKSTIDEQQIRQWWRWWPSANIGIDTGKSGLLIVDADSYKEVYAGDTLPLDERTITSLTGGGGQHLWYLQPAGNAYGNATGDLPAGIDIRGEGGYIVAPPSLHKSGNRYRFSEGHSPKDLGVYPLPSALATLLEAARSEREALPVNFSTNLLDAPDLARWPLADTILDLIHHGAAKGERSEADQKVITALARVGATDDEIRAVFVHCAIGGKYEERGDRYLSKSIGKARAWLSCHPSAPAMALDTLRAARSWGRSPACLDQLRASGVQRVGDLVRALDALLEMAMQRRSSRLVTSYRDIADRYGVHGSTACRHLAKLEAAGLVTTSSDPYGTLVDLAPLLALAQHNEVDPTATVSPNVYSVAVRSTSENDFYADHRSDDAFTSYPYSYAIKRRQASTVLMQSLGSSGLLLWDALIDGGTVKELAERKGLTVAAVRVTLKRFDQDGLLVIWQEGRAKVYELHPDAEERLEERREHMVTAGIGQLRAARNASDKAFYAQRKLQGRMPLEPREKAKLQLRRDQADTKAAAHIGVLEALGINPFC